MVDFQNFKKTIVSGTCITALLLLGLLHDNTDYKDTVLENFHQKLESDFFLEDGFKQLLKKYDSLCINGKDKSKLDTKEQYEEFLRGPCAPIIFVPGILGTSLQLKIDCETLQSKNPEIFSNCGWGTCSSYNLLQKKPASEYKLWIGDVFSKASFLQISEKSKCFGDLIGLVYNKERNILEAKEGLEVTWYGNTEQTKNDSKCGANSVRDFTKNPILKKMSCAIRGFGNLIDLLEVMGYQSGLTFQALPYDFRQDVSQSDTQTLIPKVIDHIYEMTGKKSIILGHSLGNLHILNSLSNIPQETKDSKIKQFIAAGPPFIGSPKAFISMLGGDPDYLKKILGKSFGMNYYSQMQLSSGCSSTFDILIKDSFERFKNEEWMIDVIKRIDYEENGIIENSVPFNFLPEPNEDCVNNVFDTRIGGKCKSGLINLQKEPILSINNEQFKANKEDINKIIENYSIYDAEQQKNLFKKASESRGLYDLINPNVPVSIIYGNVLETEWNFNYKKHTREVFEKTNNFYFPEDIKTGLGDGTVPTFSAILPGFKWFHEYQKSKENSKPIKLVEICSNIKKNNPFYDSTSISGEQEQNKSEYRGIDCECSKGGDIGNCYHSCFINDQFFLDFIVQSLITNQQSNINSSQYTSDELDELMQSCPALQLQKLDKKLSEM
ncbi:lecithin-cholesterol acyltransferase (macronuclear) [Tetrahymena thermophila SB210]|uniref:Lecithin-cholesterol acyltransferase n=1 Tax=Tetrahymena thermophila (strain SB210) TaxID=312017 RepID=I7MIS1_TETTS|nr:lecithin-cholesterol acyltransferase [Tetrahymena thermophila SB210]EAS04696.2 lecithin-cholesterol acyltransferase [Tetrahymena thermophila SB210]|eukprot:XP_001024941.2 lecithin-cholesterol acyltransferase [Tetrahymena thermophila SB210]